MYKPDEAFHSAARLVLRDYTRWLTARYNMSQDNLNKPVDEYMLVMDKRIQEILEENSQWMITQRNH